MNLDAVSGLLQWTPSLAQVGSHVVILAALDPDGAGSEQTFRLTAAVNDPPKIESDPDTEVEAGSRYGYDVHASDPNGDPLTFRLEAGPSGMQIDAHGRVTWSPTLSDVGTHNVEVRVADDRGAWIGQGYELKVLLEDELPKVSVWMTADPKAIQVGTTVTFYVAATDNVGVQELSLAVGGTPVALQPAGFGHVEQGSLKMDVLGAIPLVAKATDTSGQEAQYSVDLNVVEHVDVGAPVVATTSPPKRI